MRAIKVWHSDCSNRKQNETPIEKQPKGERKMKKNKANKIADKRELTQEEIKAIAGGIGTVPLPD
jgi:hypothetical protein